MKKVVKIIGIIILLVIILVIVLIAYTLLNNYRTLNVPHLNSNYYEESLCKGALESKYALKGECDVSYMEYPSSNEAIKMIRIWYPSELDENHQRYPLIMVVNGSQSPAKVYMPFFERLASWGFIVIGNDDPQTGTGDTASITLDFVLNESMISESVDQNHMGIIGYSQGGAGALAAVTNHDNGSLYRTIFTGSAAYPLLASNMGWKYTPEKIAIPYFMTAATGISDDRNVPDINAEFAGVAPLKSLVEIYDSMSDTVLKVRARAVGAEHEEMQLRTDGYMTAWMLFQLKGDKEASSVFCGEYAEIVTNPSWQDVQKNK